MNLHSLFQEKGAFMIGCNYWASHAGTAMWADWNPQVVERDLKLLSSNGIKVLRVFPLWPDFQPIKTLYGGKGRPVEIRHGEMPLDGSDMGRAGISPQAIKRFEEFLSLSEKFDLKLTVELITGWMSGRLYVPPALEGRDILTDRMSLTWQIRFAKYFTKHFIDHPAILAWGLGNECNCMQDVPDREAAWLWTATIANAIRSVDKDRPILSGMHSLLPSGKWRIQDQGELTDVLTTHPYTLFTPHCGRDPINTMRPILHATAESCLYSDIGHKPCIVQEIGAAPMTASGMIAADFARTNLFSLWANGCPGFLWWCSNDLGSLEHAPYDWNSIERELGLIKADGTPKPVIHEMHRFGTFLENLPFSSLPKRTKEAICILSIGQDSWGVAFSSFILAKQAGFDLEFQYQDQPIKDAPLYLLPCISGLSVISRRQWKKLLEKVAQGSTLYISYNGGCVGEFEEVTGLQVQTRRQGSDINITMHGFDEKTVYRIKTSANLKVDPIRAETIGCDETGNTIFSQAPYGKGHVYFLGVPVELDLINQPGTFDPDTKNPWWKVYQYFAREAVSTRVVKKESPQVGVTEHFMNDRSCIIVMVNYSPELVEAPFVLADGWCITDVLRGTAKHICGYECVGQIAANDVIVLSVMKGDV